MKHFLITLLCSSLFALHVQAQEAKSYPDNRGGEVYFPMGAISFADEVISYEVGSPSPNNLDSRTATYIVGEPNNQSVSLGCSGVIVVRFVDNSLIDIEGPDLYVFEIGPMVEATHLEISADGQTWVDAGPISGSTAEIDIASFVTGDTPSFQYVKLTDRNIDCRPGNYSGADIDAVGAIGAAVRVTLSGNVLFEFDSAELKEEAQQELDRVATLLVDYPGARVVVEGHTDSRGSDAYNLNLSRERAASVRDYLSGNETVKVGSFSVHGYGEARPVASNTTDEGRQSNRRVDLIIIPN